MTSPGYLKDLQDP